MSKKRFKNKNEPKQNQKNFWEKEYKTGTHLAMSNNPSEDLVKFTRWLEKESRRKYLNPIASVLDLGCGNGRNLIYLAKTFGMRGIGYDTSGEAISQARQQSKALPIKYEVKSVAENILLSDNSQTLVLDMMVSHYLNKEERGKLLKEILRVLKPNGWLFWKTFLRDEDRHAEQLIEENPAEEEGSYIHPVIGVTEHTFTEDEITEVLSDNFIIHKIYKSQRHRGDIRSAKRRSISVYAQKVEF